MEEFSAQISLKDLVIENEGVLIVWEYNLYHCQPLPQRAIICDESSDADFHSSDSEDNYGSSASSISLVPHTVVFNPLTGEFIIKSKSACLQKIITLIQYIMLHANMNIAKAYMSNKNMADKTVAIATIMDE